MDFAWCPTSRPCCGPCLLFRDEPSNNARTWAADAEVEISGVNYYTPAGGAAATWVQVGSVQWAGGGDPIVTLDMTAIPIPANAQGWLRGQLHYRPIPRLGEPACPRMPMREEYPEGPEGDQAFAAAYAAWQIAFEAWEGDMDVWLVGYTAAYWGPFPGWPTLQEIPGSYNHETPDVNATWTTTATCVRVEFDNAAFHADYSEATWHVPTVHLGPEVIDAADFQVMPIHFGINNPHIWEETFECSVTAKVDRDANTRKLTCKFMGYGGRLNGGDFLNDPRKPWGVKCVIEEATAELYDWGVPYTFTDFEPFVYNPYQMPGTPWPGADWPQGDPPFNLAGLEIRVTFIDPGPDGLPDP
jgi:hypothetical protein